MVAVGDMALGWLGEEEGGKLQELERVYKG